MNLTLVIVGVKFDGATGLVIFKAMLFALFERQPRDVSAATIITVPGATAASA
jgi:hypothetical protein